MELDIAVLIDKYLSCEAVFGESGKKLEYFIDFFPS